MREEMIHVTLSAIVTLESEMQEIGVDRKLFNQVLVNLFP